MGEKFPSFQPNNSPIENIPTEPDGIVIDRADTMSGNPPKMEVAGEINTKEQKVFKPGDKVSVINSEGIVESGWQFITFDGNEAVLGRMTKGSDRMEGKRCPKENIRKSE